MASNLALAGHLDSSVGRAREDPDADPAPETRPPHAVITFENVTMTYPGQQRAALDHVSVDIEKGEFVFLVGASGSGKSTFLKLVLRETRPTQGKVYVAGKEINRLAGWKVPALRRQIGTVFQDFRLLRSSRPGGVDLRVLMRQSLMIVSEDPSCARCVEAPGVVAIAASRRTYVHSTRALLDSSSRHR